MAPYLSAQWMDRYRELGEALPETPGASARVQHVVTGSPDGDVRYATVVEDGRVREQALGDDPEADVTLTTSYDDAVAIARGELDANAAFMQGRVKASGSMGSLMALLGATERPEHRALRQQLAAETDFPTA